MTAKTPVAGAPTPTTGTQTAPLRPQSEGRGDMDLQGIMKAVEPLALRAVGWCGWSAWATGLIASITKDSVNSWAIALMGVAMLVAQTVAKLYRGYKDMQRDERAKDIAQALELSRRATEAGTRLDVLEHTSESSAMERVDLDARLTHIEDLIQRAACHRCEHEHDATPPPPAKESTPK